MQDSHALSPVPEIQSLGLGLASQGLGDKVESPGLPVQAPEAQVAQEGRGGLKSLSSASQVTFRYTQPKTEGDREACAQ